MFDDTLCKVKTGYAGALYSSGTVGGSDCGFPIDTRGFNAIMAVLSAGVPNGTAGDGILVNVKFQESATINGTGTAWSDIGDGKLNGTMSLSSQLLMGTTIMGNDKAYERLDDANRKRYIRANPYITGSAGVSLTPVGVSLLLLGAGDTYYINADATAAITDTYAGAGYTGADLYNTYI